MPFLFLYLGVLTFCFIMWLIDDSVIIIVCAGMQGLTHGGPPLWISQPSWLPQELSPTKSLPEHTCQHVSTWQSPRVLRLRTAMFARNSKKLS